MSHLATAQVESILLHQLLVVVLQAAVRHEDDGDGEAEEDEDDQENASPDEDVRDNGVDGGDLSWLAEKVITEISKAI